MRRLASRWGCPPSPSGSCETPCAPGVREALLTCGRKNAKSAVLAVLMLGFLAEDGPLRRQGFRAGVASVSREKAGELWSQMEAIALASGLEGYPVREGPETCAVVQVGAS